MDYTAAYAEQNLLLADLLRAADLTTPVPTCPGWTLRKLLVHVGRGDRWAAMIVRDRAEDRVDIRSVGDGQAPEDPAAAADWLVGAVPVLTGAVAATGADTPVWTFTGPRPAGWWVRRRLAEAVVHGADAALALGRPFDVDPVLAADLVSEWLDLLAAREAADPPLLPDGGTLHLHTTDDGLGAGGEWMIRSDAGRVVWEHGHGKGTAAVRGPATVLLLALLRRLPADDERLQVIGDGDVWRTWVERTPF
ncbi:hypothetical protein BJF78_22580 [Pseudonocardia sp. CNS-139]|nr:hypothetical protein BJF78_22580 [Pseudonocardia sp. CNS-139]